MRKVLTICAAILVCAGVAGCGAIGDASGKGLIEAWTSRAKLVTGETVTTTTAKDGTVTVVKEPAHMTAEGPGAKVHSGDRLSYNWGIFRIQKLFNIDTGAAGPGANQSAPETHLKESPAIALNYTPDGHMQIEIGEADGVRAIGVKIKTSWIWAVMQAVGAIMAVLIIYKAWPYIMQGIKWLWGKLGPAFEGIWNKLMDKK